MAEYIEENCRLLLAAVLGQAVYDFRCTVKAGVLKPDGKLNMEGIKTDRHHHLATNGPSGNTRLAGDITKGEVHALSRQVRCNNWVMGVSGLAGHQINSAKEFRSLSLNRRDGFCNRRLGRLSAQ